jgi:hypothetical protein
VMIQASDYWYVGGDQSSRLSLFSSFFFMITSLNVS